MSDQTIREIDWAQFFVDYRRRWSTGMRAKLQGGRPIEPHVTAALCALIGPAADTVIDFILAQCGIGRESGWRYEIWNGSDMRKSRLDGGGPVGRREPDLFVIRWRGEAEELVVAVEAKLDAQVNGFDCPAGVHRGYSNQIICYVHGCWLSPTSQGQTAAYLWLGRARDIQEGRFPRHALNGNDAKTLRASTEDARAWLGTQTEAAALWHRASWEDLLEVLAPQAPGLAKAVQAFLGVG